MTPRPPVRASAPAFLQRLTSKILSGSGSFVQRLSKGKMESAVGVTVGAVWVLSAPVFVFCAAVDFLDRGPDCIPLLVSGLIVGLLGLLVVRLSSFPSSLPVSRLFASVVSGAVAALIAVTVAHLATDTSIALDVALVEAAATVTGTNASTLNADSMSLGVTLFRALGQWLSAGAIIVVLVRVMPHLGVGGLDADGGVATRSARRLAPRSGSTMARLVSLYIGLTVLCAFACLPLMFRALRRGDLHRFVRSVEFRTYIGLILISVVACIAWSDTWPTVSDLRHSLFAVVSALSTTGYLAGDLESVSYGSEAVLLVLMVVGGMSASVAGGFKVMRFMVLGRYIRRELRRSIHPALVGKIHLGRSVIGEVALSRIIGELFLASMTIIPIAMLFSADGLDLEAAISFAVSSLSNVGFAFGLGGPDGHLQMMGAVGHLAAALMMLVGRVSITPVLVTLGGVGEPLQRKVRHMRRTATREVLR